MFPTLSKNGVPYTAAEKTTTAATGFVSAATVAYIINLFLAFTSGMPIEQKLVWAAVSLVVAGIVVCVMYYTSKKYGIDWPEIIAYVMEVLKYIETPEVKPNPEPSKVLPVAKFGVETQAGPLPQTAQFRDQSEHADEYLWAFGDGAGSNEPSPSHAYQMYGPYDVTLTVTNSDGSDSARKTVNIREPEMPAGVQFAQWNGATVVFILVPVWKDGGGRIVNDGGKDSPDYYPIVYKLSNEDTLKLEQQGYYELPTNTVHSLVDDPFSGPETKLDVQNRMEQAEQPMEFLMQWLADKRARADRNLEKALLILPQSAIDQMKGQCGEKGSAYDDYVAGLPLCQDGQPGGLVLAYKNWLAQHNKAGQLEHATPLLEKYF